MIGLHLLHAVLRHHWHSHLLIRLPAVPWGIDREMDSGQKDFGQGAGPVRDAVAREMHLQRRIGLLYHILSFLGHAGTMRQTLPHSIYIIVAHILAVASCGMVWLDARTSKTVCPEIFIPFKKVRMLEWWCYWDDVSKDHKERSPTLRTLLSSQKGQFMLDYVDYVRMFLFLLMLDFIGFHALGADSGHDQKTESAAHDLRGGSGSQRWRECSDRSQAFREALGKP